MTEPTEPTIDVNAPIQGPYGHAEPVPHPSPDDPALTDRSRAALRHSVCTYLVTSPGWHPLWSQYVLSVITLDDDDQLPPPHRKFDGATHELIVFAINPDKRLTAADVTGHSRTGDLPFLTPINIAEQFECTSEEIHAVAWLCCRAVVHGRLNPETADAPTLIRGAWLTACTKTLAHLRGEAHAS